VGAKGVGEHFVKNMIQDHQIVALKTFFTEKQVALLQIGKEKLIEIISDKMLKLKPCLETEIFKQCCEQKQKVNVVIMLDGFDEISPDYKETVIDLLQALRQTAVEQLWVTTRPHLREELEDELRQLSYTLEPFSEENQVEFLTRFWSLKTASLRWTVMGKRERK
jgi:predicted NACHT family NTPase